MRPLRCPDPGTGTNRPSSEDSYVGAGQASGLIPWGGASPLRDSAGIAPASLAARHPGLPGTGVPYPSLYWGYGNGLGRP